MDRGSIVGLIMVGAVLGCGAYKAFRTAWDARYAEPGHEARPPTQRLRYGLTIFGVTFGWLAAGLPVYFAGIGDTLRVLDEFRDASWYGWVITAIWLLALMSPLYGLITAIHIYRYPAPFAKKERGEYVKTVTVRRRKRRR